MKTYNPAGPVHLMMRGPSADARIEHARQTQYVTCTVLDDVGLSARMQREAQVPYSVARIYAFEPHANTTDEAAVREYARARYQDLRNLRSAAGNANVLFQVNNEQGFRQDDFMMYVHLIDFAMNDPDGPVGMVFWNGATGSVPNGFWAGHGTDYRQQDNGWAQDWALRFVRRMHEVRDVRLPGGAYAFLLGAHMYSMYYPLIAVNAGMHRKAAQDRWNTQYANAWDAHRAFLDGTQQVDWRLPQDHIGRDVQAIRLALGYIGTPNGMLRPGPETPALDGVPADCPRMIVTECGPDAMNDVLHVHLSEYVPQGGFALPTAFSAQQITDVQAQAADAHMRSLSYARGLNLPESAFPDTDIYRLVAQSAGGPRGYRTMTQTWAQASWFPDAPTGTVLAFWHRWVWECVLEPTGVVVGMQPFCEGDTGGWEGFNVHGDDAYHQAMEQWIVEIPAHWLGENGEEPAMPYREITAELVNMGEDTELRVRAEANTSSTKLGVIREGDTIGYALPVTGQDIGGGRGDQWVPVYIQAANGPAEGYAHAHFLRLPDDQPDEPEEPSKTIEEVKADVIDLLHELIERVKTL